VEAYSISEGEGRAEGEISKEKRVTLRVGQPLLRGEEEGGVLVLNSRS